MEKQDSSTHESESGTTPIVERRRPYYPKFLRPRIVISGIVIAIVLATGLYYGIPYIEYQIDRRAKFSETEVTDGRPPFPEEEMPEDVSAASSSQASGTNAYVRKILSMIPLKIDDMTSIEKADFTGGVLTFEIGVYSTRDADLKGLYERIKYQTPAGNSKVACRLMFNSEWNKDWKIRYVYIDRNNSDKVITDNTFSLDQC